MGYDPFDPTAAVLIYECYESRDRQVRVLLVCFTYVTILVLLVVYFCLYHSGSKKSRCTFTYDTILLNYLLAAHSKNISPVGCWLCDTLKITRRVVHVYQF